MSSHRTTPLPPGPRFDMSPSSPPPPPPPKPSRTGARTSNSSSHTPHNAQNATSPLPPPPPPPLPPPPNASSATDPRSGKTPSAQQPLPPEHWLPETLLEKPITALSPLLSSPNILTALSSAHPSIHPSPLPPHLATTAALADHVISSHERLLQLRHATQQHLLQLHGLERAWRELQQRMDAVLEPWSAKALYRRLGAAEREAEEVSRAVEEAFLDGGAGGSSGGGSGGGLGDPDGKGEGKASERELAEFCRRYREGRGVVGRRREWRERWDEGRVGGWR